MEFFKTHKVWKVIGIIVVIIIIAHICVVMNGGYHRGDLNKTPNTITVSGTGEVVVKPDIATISFGVSAENLDVAKAQTESATKINNIIDFLKKNSVEDKDIKTTNYNIYPRYDYKAVNSIYPSGKQVLAAYVVSQTVEVKIRDLTKSGAILSGIGGLGATDISGLTFSVDKVKDVENQARDAAIKDARTQAQVLADELGVKLVKITSFSENANTPIYYGMNKVMAAPAVMDSVAPQMPAGENKITSNVSITYEIR